MIYTKLAMSHTTPPQIAVIIPHFNDERRLYKCLQALSNQTLPSDSYQVIVVDNGSTTAPEATVQQFDNVVLLVEHKPGSYSARNKAIKQFNSPIYAFTDSDCIPEPDWLESAVNKLQENANIDAVSGPITLFSNKQNRPNAIELIDMCFAFPQEQSIALYHYAPTANLIVRKSAFERVGIFNDSLMSGGDAEWGLRLHEQNGCLVYDAAVVIHHPARDSVTGYFTKIRRTTHGLWARRQSSPQARKALRLKSLLLLVVPPLQRMRQLFNFNKEVSFSTKLKASSILYFGKLYKLQQILLCALGLVASPERR